MTKVPDIGSTVQDGSSFSASYSSPNGVIMPKENDHSESERYNPSENGDNGGLPEEEMVAPKENRAVWYLRILVFFVLFLVASVVCVSVYLVSEQAETQDFEDDFEDIGTKLVSSFESTLKQRFGILEEFAQDVTSYVHDSQSLTAGGSSNNNMDMNSTDTTTVRWPFVALPNYEQRAMSSVRLADLFSLVMMPIVSESDRADWDDFVVANEGWRAEGIALQRGVPVDDVVVPPVHATVSNFSMLPDVSPGPYIPLWQLAPSVPTPMINVNLFSHPHYHKTMRICMEKKRPVLTGSYDFWDPETRDSDPRRPLHQMYMDANEDFGTIYTDDPVVPLFYPGRCLPRLILAKRHRSRVSFRNYQYLDSILS